MTLVQNLLRQLSGNKIILFSILCLFLVSSCKTKKTVVETKGTRTQTPSTNRPGPKSKVDTIRWTESVLENDEAVTTETPIEFKSNYKIAILIPFESNRYEPRQFEISGSKENRFANYYSGVKLALDKLNSEGANFTVQIIDSGVGNINPKLNNLKEVDLIIGPYSRAQLKETAEFCRKNEIVNISPWQASSKIAQDNPFHVQLRPNQTAYYDAMVEDAISKYDLEQIWLVGRNTKTDKGRINYFQESAAAIVNKPKGVLNEYMIDVDSLINDALTYDEIFVEDKKNVFLFPQWSSEDEPFLYDCLRKLAIEKGLNDLVVYGMPVMIDSDKISYDYFQNLDIHVTRAKWVDRNDPDVRAFRKYYFDRYNALAEDDALDGYDMMMFIGSNLMKDGKTFQHTLDQDRSRYLQTSFDIQKVVLSEEERLDNFNKIDYFENRNLDIIRFRKDRLVRE